MIFLWKGSTSASATVLMVLVMMVAAEDPILPDIWKVVEDSYDSTVTINFPFQVRRDVRVMVIDWDGEEKVECKGGN